MFTAYEKQLTTSFSYADINGQMTLCNLLKESQQISMEQCDSLGVTMPYMAQRGIAFILVKQRIRIHRMPLGGERLRFVTDPSVNGIIYRRCNTLFAQSGEALAEVDARWVLMDTKNARIIRYAPDEIAQKFIPGEKAADIRLPALQTMQSLGRIRVPYSMCDTNQHMNNASYADVITDAVADLLLQGKQVEEFTIVYSQQLPLGSSFELMRLDEQNESYIYGTNEGTTHFQSLLRFK